MPDLCGARTGGGQEAAGRAGRARLPAGQRAARRDRFPDEVSAPRRRYYFNVGCSDLIVEGKIGLIQHDDIDRFVPEGVRMKDGSVREAELLVAATGYKNQQDVVRRYFGDEIADRIGPVRGFDKGGEQRNMWRRTAQPGLWFTARRPAACAHLLEIPGYADQGGGGRPAGRGGRAAGPDGSRRRAAERLNSL
jgi:hypothetical protein